MVFGAPLRHPPQGNSRGSVLPSFVTYPLSTKAHSRIISTKTQNAYRKHPPGLSPMGHTALCDWRKLPIDWRCFAGAWSVPLKAVMNFPDEAGASWCIFFLFQEESQARAQVCAETAMYGIVCVSVVEIATPSGERDGGKGRCKTNEILDRSVLVQEQTTRQANCLLSKLKQPQTAHLAQ
jgi:hypothetical protein